MLYVFVIFWTLKFRFKGYVTNIDTNRYNIKIFILFNFSNLNLYKKVYILFIVIFVVLKKYII